MSFDKPIVQTSNPFKKVGTYQVTRTIYYGEVISITDNTDGGRIQVKIPDLDNKTANTDLPYCYPMLPKFFHLLPQVGEMVRVFIEDIKYPERSRYWMGSIISQPQKIGFDTIYTALSTTNMGLTIPEPAPSTLPDAKGVFPLSTDVAIIGKVNTDVILRTNEVHIRAGKHENGNVLKLNTKNPASVNLVFEQQKGNANFYSNTVVFSDKIALISHTGKPQFKAAELTADDRTRIFTEGHPIARGDVLIEALNILRNAIINHIHGYSNLPADKNALIKDLENINFDNILQKNIVIN
ncbi:MAG: hypothetical protein WC428_00770 [Candidatus Paceibacterota bacterium]